MAGSLIGVLFWEPIEPTIADWLPLQSWGNAHEFNQLQVSIQRCHAAGASEARATVYSLRVNHAICMRLLEPIGLVFASSRPVFPFLQQLPERAHGYTRPAVQHFYSDNRRPTRFAVQNQPRVDQSILCKAISKLCPAVLL